MTLPSAGADTAPAPGGPADGLRVSGLSKTFPGVRALKDMSIRIKGGSVHALLGHNGCGKSTFVKTLAGFHQPDNPCEASLDGEPLQLGSAEDAARLGVRFVHQELGLIPELGPIDNVGLALGYERSRFGANRWGRQERVTEELLARFDIHLDPRLPLALATPVERTAVAIVRAVAGWEAGHGLLVLDEPTASLPAREVEELFRLIRDIRDSGTAVLLISHRLDEVMSIADHATVMRSGEVIYDGPTSEMSVRAFATLIAGKETIEAEETHRLSAGHRFGNAAPALRLERISGRYLRGVDLEVREGEIVGVAGLLGSGREELPYVVAGANDEEVSGKITVGGQPIEKMTIQRAKDCGVALVPADRAHEGVFTEFSVKENVSIVALPTLCRGRTLGPGRERAFAQKWLTALTADATTAERPIMTLSGGNQQKVMLARWLSIGPKVLALSEPTAGVDIGARMTIYEELRRRAEDGLAILLSSSDADDLVAVCDRVIVLRDGEIAAELDGQEISKSAIVAAMEGVHGEQ
ncbi:MAG: ribose transport system ATP-binding protein [bacterium]